MEALKTLGFSLILSKKIQTRSPSGSKQGIKKVIAAQMNTDYIERLFVPVCGLDERSFLCRRRWIGGEDVQNVFYAAISFSYWL